MAAEMETENVAVKLEENTTENDENNVEIAVEMETENVAVKLEENTTENDENKVEMAAEMETENVDVKLEENDENKAKIDEKATENNVKTEENNPYAYLDRDEFSSEKFKIEIKNLPKFYGIQQLRKLLNETLKLNSCKLKTPFRNSSFAFVCFRNDTDRENAITALQNYKWKGTELTAIKAKPAPDPLVRKRKNDERNMQIKKLKQDDRSAEERLMESTIPWHKQPYEEQLVKKQEEMKTFLKKMSYQMVHQNSDLKSLFEEKRKLYDGLPCELLDIRHAKKIDGYRNKCEFSVGINEETGLKTVGFRIGSYVNGITGVGPIENLRHVSDEMKAAAKVFEKFVRESELEVFNPEHQSGQFKQLMVRQAEKQLMLVVGICPKDMTPERVESLKKELIEFFYEKDGKDLNVTSLYYQPILKKVSNDDDSCKPIHLHGATHIYENILGLKFRVSPEAFFQINTEAAEVLYKTAIELAQSGQESTVVDICCGTGTIGLCFSKECNQVLGVEIIPQAIEDAKQNAIENKIENSEFYAGKAEDMIHSTFSRAKNEDVIAIVDPPRAGLHDRAIVTLRKIKKLQKLVYISCNPRQAMKNFVDLSRAPSKKMFGEPLVPVKAVAVDLFPHTPHCELVMVFERLPSD